MLPSKSPIPSKNRCCNLISMVTATSHIGGSRFMFMVCAEFHYAHVIKLTISDQNKQTQKCNVMQST